MIASMTGYGRGTATAPLGSLTVEVRAVNGRQREVRCRLPQPLFELEPVLRGLVQQHVARGRVDVYVTFDVARESATLHALDIAAARSLVAAWRELQSQLGLPDEPRAEAVLRMPGVIEPRAQQELDLEAARTLVAEAAGLALAQFTEARRREGEQLARDLRVRARRITELIATLERLLEGSAERQAAALRERVAALLGEIPLDESRAAQEIALLAQRADATEEIVRLHAHAERIESLLAPEKSQVGRELEFVVQEMRREINTLGVKAAAPEVDEQVLAFKSELEKIREQAANIE